MTITGLIYIPGMKMSGLRGIAIGIIASLCSIWAGHMHMYSMINLDQIFSADESYFSFFVLIAVLIGVLSLFLLMSFKDHIWFSMGYLLATFLILLFIVPAIPALQITGITSLGLFLGYFTYHFIAYM